MNQLRGTIHIVGGTALAVAILAAAFFGVPQLAEMASLLP